MKTQRWADVKRSSKDPVRAARVRARVERELVEMNLAELRKELGVTQVEAAKQAAISQAELSRTENRDDHLVSTVRRYVEALGGELELVAVVGDKRVKLVV